MKGQDLIYMGLGVMVVMAALVITAGLGRLLFAIVFGPCQGGL